VTTQTGQLYIFDYVIYTTIIGSKTGFRVRTQKLKYFFSPEINCIFVIIKKWFPVTNLFLKQIFIAKKNLQLKRNLG